jgi:hypothetical protein
MKDYLSDKIKTTIQELQDSTTWYDEYILTGKLVAFMACRDYLEHTEKEVEE